MNVATGISYEHFDNITYKTIEIADVPESKIVAHFPEAFNFIDEGRKSGGVLVMSKIIKNDFSPFVNKFRYIVMLEFLDPPLR